MAITMTITPTVGDRIRSFRAGSVGTVSIPSSSPQPVHTGVTGFANNTGFARSPVREGISTGSGTPRGGSRFSIGGSVNGQDQGQGGTLVSRGVCNVGVYMYISNL